MCWSQTYRLVMTLQLLPAAAARLAQSVEHETLNLRVVGSSPTLGAFLFFRSIDLSIIGLAVDGCVSFSKPILFLALCQEYHVRMAEWSKALRSGRSLHL